MAVTDWVPATEAELAMRDALRVDDQETYFRILAGSELLLPVSAEALQGHKPLGWGTWTSGDRTHLLAFTSPPAMAACLAEQAGSARKISYHDLAQNWPNPEWWLAVNPGLPIESYLPPWFVAQLASGDARLPGRGIRTRARVDRVESFQRARAVASVPGRLSAPAPPAVVPRQPVSPISPAGPGPGQSSAAPPLPTRVPSVPPPSGIAALGGGTSIKASATVRASVRIPASAPAGPSAPSPAQSEAAPVADSAAGSRDPSFQPANDVERNLLEAAEAGNTDSFLSTLLLATVLLRVPPGVPSDARPGDPAFRWLTETIDEQPYVVVFTSPERLRDHAGAQAETVSVRFVHLIRHWPDEQWSFAVNPGSPVGAKLPGAQIIALANWADEMGLGQEPAEEPAAEESARPDRSGAPAADGSPSAEPTVMQKVVPPAQVAYYLERGYDRVSGFVHRAAEVAHLRTPADLFTALGLGYTGSPFSKDDPEVHVLRWAAHRPNLYRIPYGGQHEAGMRAMRGWVIERAPFRGNGFAPSDSGDIIAEFKVDSVRLPHGAQLWRITADGTETLVATFDADKPGWQRAEPEA